MDRKRWSRAAFMLIAAIVAWSLPLTYHIGIDGKVYEKSIPLYAKACGFLYRDWMYKDIVRGIVSGGMGEEEKVLAILKWTNENISNEVPKGLKVVDDHPLNIIVRQYGAGDQIDDIFTILCSYAGMKAGAGKCYNSDRTRHIILSFVRVNGRWLMIDASKNKHFINKKGGVGSVGDYLSGDLILPDYDQDKSGIHYKDYLTGLRHIDFSYFSRPEEQMPLRRPVAEFKKLFGGIKK